LGASKSLEEVEVYLLLSMDSLKLRTKVCIDSRGISTLRGTAKEQHDAGEVADLSCCITSWHSRLILPAFGVHVPCSGLVLLEELLVLLLGLDERFLEEVGI
jgi:hypothetical protein